MKKTFLSFLLFIISIAFPIFSMSKEELLERLSKERYFPYQDILINGELLSKGVGPDCSTRYEAIKKVLAKYNNSPIKVLDIGASNGYFSLRIAQDFNALCVMVDVSDRLTEICKLNDMVSNIVYMKKALTLDDLKDLVKREHFDVVLALNVVHHMTPWKEITDAIFNLGDTIIVETPPANDERAKEEPSVPLIEEYLVNKANGHIIAHTPRAAANNFDHLTSLKENNDAIKQKKCTPNALAKMFCFADTDIKNTVQKPFNLSTFDTFGGQYACLKTEQGIEKIEKK